MSLSQTLLPTVFNKSDEKVRGRMLPMPDKLRTAAMELLERVRVGLNIPSRAEVLDLAARIEAISEQLGRLEAVRAADHKLVEELRQNSQEVGESKKSSAARKPRARSTRSKTSTRGASKSGSAKKSDLDGKKPSHAKGAAAEKAAPAAPKRKPRARKANAKVEDK